MARRRKKAATSSRKKKTKKKENKVTFKAFFSKCVNTGVLNYWQESEVYAFFKSVDLKDKEDLDTYQKALENF